MFRRVLMLLVLGILSACATTPDIVQPTGRKPATHDMEAMGMPAWSPATAAKCQSSHGFTEGDRLTVAQQDIINQTVGTRGHRLLHALWHADRAGLSEQQSQEAMQSYGISWSEEHKYCPPPQVDWKSDDYNPVGEDFLYMHRVMLEQVRGGMVVNELACVAGWDKVPDLATSPLPDSDTSGPKSAEALAQLQVWDSKLQDPDWLRSVSLSQLGMAVEITTHNNLHMRYATTQPPAGFAGVADTGGAPIPFDGNFAPSWQYDNVNYNWLADPYGAALNPYFWKIHGYVDALVDKWLQANNYKSIAEDCKGDPTCYQWQGTWTGSVPAKYYDMLPAHPSEAVKAEAPTDVVDSKTKDFNQRRMRKQWIGVIGGRGKLGAASKAAAAPGVEIADPTDPFQYAVQQECTQAP